MQDYSTLQKLGWKPFFHSQLSWDEMEQCTAARIIQHHRSLYRLQDEKGVTELPVGNTDLCVGDWVLLDVNQQLVRILERLSYFSRKRAGSVSAEQVIAANIDTAFIVCSLNQNFNLNRIERYLAIVKSSHAQAVVILSKKDLCNDWQEKQEQVQTLDATLPVLCLNSLDTSIVDELAPWLQSGDTLCFIGSSGVGKSTLINSLAGTVLSSTQDIRQQDGKGRHTTTARYLYSLDNGVCIIDTPGMRELQVHDIETGIQETFQDIEQLSKQCRFNDCQHESEPGCAVLSAMDEGILEARRLENYRKLRREQAHNNASIVEKREHDKNLGKLHKRIKNEKKLIKRKH